jgi:RNA polymerase sigma-70 factor, ECF subfamily
MYESAITPTMVVDDGERLLVAALCRGDEAAFEELLDRYHASMIRLALHYVRGHAEAEEVAQETWMAVLQGIQRFEGRSSLKTWIFRILVNRAKTRGVREGRTIPMSALENPDLDGTEPAVNPDRFLAADHPQWPGHWASAPQSWETNPEASALAHETRACIEAAIATLPPSQQMIITLRDVEGWTAEEVCESLGLTDANQRVLLHRARSKVRAALEQHLSPRIGTR